MSFRLCMNTLPVRHGISIVTIIEFNNNIIPNYHPYDPVDQFKNFYRQSPPSSLLENLDCFSWETSWSLQSLSGQCVRVVAIAELWFLHIDQISFIFFNLKRILLPFSRTEACSCVGSSLSPSHVSAPPSPGRIFLFIQKFCHLRKWMSLLFQWLSRKHVWSCAAVMYNVPLHSELISCSHPIIVSERLLSDDCGPLIHRWARVPIQDYMCAICEAT